MRVVINRDRSAPAIPQWSPEIAIDFMDSQEIATGIPASQTEHIFEQGQVSNGGLRP